MATKYENHTTGDDGAYSIAMTSGKAQTFTPSTSHTVTSVKLKLYRGGGSYPPGTITVSIRATSAGLPTGTDLCSGTTDGDTLTQTTTGEWREITLGAGTNLTATTVYAIYAFSATIEAFWRIDTSTGYADGTACSTTDGGDSWIELGAGAYDFMFEEWGGSGPPVVTTQAVDDIEATTARGNGTITSLGNAAVTQHGHCWNTSTNPTTSNDKTSKGTGSLGSFISLMTGLSANTLYYVRAYATNSLGTAYGANVTFTTATTDTPVVETKDCTALTGTTATGVGIIWSVGGSTVTEHGHCWHTSVNPTTALSTKTENGAGFYGAFTSAITGLTASTTYYIRAYAHNSAGTSYGNNVLIVAGVGGSEQAGPIAVVQTRLHYVDKYGVEKYIEGTPV